MKVGLVYNPIYLEHDTGSHVENASRLREIMSLLEKEKVLSQLVAMEPRQATPEELRLVHTREHIAQVEAICQRGGGWLDADTVTSPDSYRVALYAAGGVIAAVEAVMTGKVNSAFALVRPPGHHATPTRAMGFCLFNNIAIAARVALKDFKLSRVLIVDYDVHHGNGTQDAFYSDPRVLYFSTHEYPFYPGTGAVEESGEGEGKGTTVNVPLPAGCGDKEFLRVYEEILVPVARRFQPQLILVSAGYDAHWADNLAMMQLSVKGYGGIVRLVKGLADELCQGRLVFALEGGYYLPALAASVRATLDVLLGKSEVVDPLGPAQTRHRPNIEFLLREVKQEHRL